MGMTRKQLLLAEIESTYGTDPTPENSLNAIATSEVNITPLAGSNVTRNIVKPYFGNQANIIVEKYVTIDFEVEVTGHVSSSAPQYGVLLKACGFSEASVVDTGTVYSLITPSTLTQAGTSATMYFQRDGIKHILTGARGTVSFDFTVKQLPKMKFTFTGQLGTITDSALSTSGLVYNAITPIPVLTTNTEITLFGYSPVVESLTLDIANDVKYRTLVGSETVIIADRKPKGNIKFEVPSLSTKNFFDIAQNSTLGAFSITHGFEGYGNCFKVESYSGGTGIEAPKYATNDGVDMLDCGLYFVPSSTGNDELKITVS